MTTAIGGSRRHVAEQQREDESDRSREPPEESIDEVATRIPKEVGEAGARLRRDAARFDQGPPPASDDRDGDEDEKGAGR